MSSPEQMSGGWEQAEDFYPVREIYAVERRERRELFVDLRAAMHHADQFGAHPSTTSFHTFNSGDGRLSHVYFSRHAASFEKQGEVVWVTTNTYIPDEGGQMLYVQDYTAHSKNRVVGFTRDERKILPGATTMPDAEHLKGAYIHIDDGMVARYVSSSFSPRAPLSELFSGDDFLQLQKRKKIIKTLTDILFNFSDETHNAQIVIR